MQVFGSYVSPFTARVMIQIRAKGLDIPLCAPPVDIHSPEYRAVNPLGKVPALDTGERVLPESEVVAEYLEARFPEPPLLGSSPKEAAQIRLVARIADIYVMNAMLPLFANLSPKRRNQPVVDHALAAVDIGLAHLEHFVRPATYAVLERLTLAECATGPFLLYVTRFLPAFGVADPLGKVPAVAGHWEALQADRHVGAVLDDMRAALAAYA